MPEGTPWSVESLRLTVFTDTAPDLKSINWWREVTNEESEARTLQQTRGRLQEVGSIRGGVCKLSFECNVQRIDWVFSPVIAEDKELTAFPTFAPLKDGVSLYQELLLPWLDRSPPAQRIAFGAVITQSVADRKVGYKQLGKYLSAVKLDPDGSSDFSYQINRPRSSKVVPGLRINRLSKWSVSALGGMVIQITGGQPKARVIESNDKVHAVRAEFDINSAAEFEGKLPHQDLKKLSEELSALAAEIAEKGDVP